MSKYAKFYVAVAAALVSAVSVTADGEFSLNDLFVVLSAAAGAVGVYFVPNAAPVDSRHPANRGSITLTEIVLVLVGICAVVWLLKTV